MFAVLLKKGKGRRGHFEENIIMSGSGIFMDLLTGIVEFFKYGMLGVGHHEWWMLGYSFGFMVILLAIGIVVFNKVQKSFMDTV